MAKVIGIRGGVIAWLAACSTAASGHAQVQHLWHQDGVVPGSSARSVASGAMGSQVVSNIDGGGAAITLCAAGGGNPSPVIFAEGGAPGARFGSVASSAEDDLHVDLYFAATSSSASAPLVPTLRAYRSTSPASGWARQFGNTGWQPLGLPSGVHVSNSGSRIVAWWFDITADRARVVVLDDLGNTIVNTQLGPYVQPRASALSANGQKLFLNVQTGLMVLDTATGTAGAILSGWAAPTRAIAATPTGDTVAFGTVYGGIDVFRSVNGGPLSYSFSVAGPVGTAVTLLALSRDGSTLVSGSSGTNAQTMIVRIVDVASATHPIVRTDTLVAGGGFSASITDVAVSERGESVAVGTTGDQPHVLPELLVYRKSASGAFERSDLSLPGSVWDLDIARNSAVLSVASAAAHFDTSPLLASLDAYDLGSDFTCADMAHQGSTVHFLQKAAPGKRCLLLQADALAPTPTTHVGMFGSLFLHAPIVRGIALADATGVAHLPYLVPSGAADLGRTVYFQGIQLVDRRLTRFWSALTIVP